jgi:hypothetical protein
MKELVSDNYEDQPTTIYSDEPADFGDLLGTAICDHNPGKQGRSELPGGDHIPPGSQQQ